MADLEIKVEGLKELEKTLSDLPLDLQNEGLSPSLRAALEVIEEEAEANVPRDTGKLASTIRTVVKVDAGVGGLAEGAVVVGSPVGHLVEFGTQPHEITIDDEKDDKKVLADPVSREVFGRKVQHPGTPARPFLRPALDTRAQDALFAFRDKLRELLPGLVRKAAKRAPQVPRGA